MDRKEEIKQIAYDFTTSKEDCKKLENRILSLFGVISSASELAQEFKEYTEKLLLSKKDTTDFLIRTGIIDKNGDLTEHYK